jgi:hypothetical protein
VTKRSSDIGSSPPTDTPNRHATVRTTHIQPTVGSVTQRLANTNLASDSRADPDLQETEKVDEEQDGRVILSEPAELLCFDYEVDAFAHEAMVDAKIILSNYGDFNCKSRFEIGKH